MKFLVDNQIPPALARFLQAKGLDAVHVEDIEFDAATDREIWEYAIENDRAIISKDEDFLHFSMSNPLGPAFVWVRLGNCRKDALLAAFGAVLQEMLNSLDDGERVVEVR